MGSAITSSLVAKGFRVVAVARDAAALDELGASSELVVACPADIASDDAVATIKRALDTPVRMAVFAAGLPVRGSADAIDPSALAVAANIKVAGTVRLLRAVRDHLVAGSRFVAIAGSLGIEPGPSMPGRDRECGADQPDATTWRVVRPQRRDDPHDRAGTGGYAAAARADRDAVRRIRNVGRRIVGAIPRQDHTWPVAPLDEIAWLVGLLVEPQASVLHGAVLAADGGVRHGVL